MRLLNELVLLLVPHVGQARSTLNERAFEDACAVQIARVQDVARSVLVL